MTRYTLLLIALSYGTWSHAATAPECTGTSTSASDCAEMPYEQGRPGNAMIQRDSSFVKEVSPSLHVSHGSDSEERSLEADVVVLEKEMTALKQKTETLEAAVGHKSSAAELLSISSSGETLSKRVVALEADAADVNSRVGTMEREMLGSFAMSLASVPSAENGLQPRVSALKALVASLTERAYTLENKVTPCNKDVSVLEKEMAVLKSKTAALETSVGNKGSLLEVRQEKSSARKNIKSRVGSLEQDAADVKSRVTSLEAEVGGSSGVSLLEAATQKDDNLFDRVAVLKATVDDLKLRVQKLESTVTGLLQEDSRTRSLESDVVVLEREMTGLKQKTETLETAVGHKTLAAELLSISSSGETLSKRVVALEADAADVNSRVGIMETEVSGSSAMSLASVPSAANGLQPRVTALKALVASLTERAHALENKVTPCNKDVSLLEKEMAVLKSKTAALETSVGNKGSLLAVSQEKAGARKDIKSRVGSLEQDAADVKSRVTSLEAEVDGSSGVSLLEAAVQKDDGLFNRVAKLKATVADLKARVQKLESAVTGLLQEDSMKRSLESDVVVMEREMTELKQKTNQLETAVGHRSSAAELLSTSPSAGSTLSERVRTLEGDAADVNSRVGIMENEVLGSSSVSLASVPSTEIGLQPRVTALKSMLASLIERAHKLDSKVTPCNKDVTLLEKEMAWLKSETAKLETSVGNKGSLLAVSQEKHSAGKDIKARVGSLEQDAADVKSRVTSLETEVGESVGVSLLETAPQKDDNLFDRVATLKTTVADLKARVQKLGHKVTGLFQDAEKPALAAPQVLSSKEQAPAASLVTSGNSKMEFLNADVGLMESEVKVLLEKTSNLESKLGQATFVESAATGVELAENTSVVVGNDTKAKAESLIAVDRDELKKRVNTLEKNVADVDSRVSSMENMVKGLNDASLVEVTKIGHGQEKPLGLKSRVEALKASVANLQGRVQRLEVDVTGLLQVSAKPVASDPKYLDMHLSLIEEELASLKKTTGSLETKVGRKIPFPSLITEAIQRISRGQDTEGEPFQRRVTALKADTEDVKSRVSWLETEFSETSDVSLLEVSRALLTTVVDLENRIGSLQRRVNGSLPKA